MRYKVILLLLFFAFGLKAQKIYDPEAEKLLRKVNMKITDARQVSAKFTFGINYFEQEEKIESGILIQEANNYFVSIGDNDVISTGEGFYLVDKVAKNVQINDAIDPEATDLYNPISLMQKYDSGEFEYAIVGEEKVNGVNCILIEFKPTDRYSDLSKIRIALDKSEKLPLYVKIFNKDASRINIIIKELKLLDKITSEVKFDSSTYPSFEIEDLRLD